MSLEKIEVENIAHLARLAVVDEDIDSYAQDLSNILDLVKEMNRVNTDGIIPMAHPLEVAQRLRPDEVSEINQRDLFQSTAPQVEDGLYLVPKVIE